MSTYENGLFSYIEGRLLPLERNGKCYFFRSNSFAGRITRYDGSQGFVKNNKKGMPDIVACFPSLRSLGANIRGLELVGQFVGFELKTPTGRQSPAQKLAQAHIESAGGRYHIIRTPEEFEVVLKAYL